MIRNATSTSIQIRTLRNDNLGHIARVKELANANSKYLGFFPSAAFDGQIEKGKVLVAESPDGRCAGYVFFNVANDYVRIAHLCVAPEFRRTGVARALVKALSEMHRSRAGIRLRCRRDFPANDLWPTLGFVIVAEMTGKNSAGKPLVSWLLDHGHQTLFSRPKEAETDTAIVAAIDANILFDLKDASRESAQLSHALQADWLEGFLELCVTDEVFTEINRHDDPIMRKESHAFARSFPSLPSAPARFEEMYSEVRTLFPASVNVNTESDIRQIARAAAAGASFFVTKDGDLLALADDILRSVPLTVLDPTRLILQFDEYRRASEYEPVQFVGASLQLRRINSTEIDTAAAAFQNVDNDERKSDLVAKLRRCLAVPDAYQAKVLIDGGGKYLALAVIAEGADKGMQLDVPILRVAAGPLAPTVARQIVRHVVLIAIDKRVPLVNISDKLLTPTVEDAAYKSGFCGGPPGMLQKVNVFGIHPTAAVATLGESLSPFMLEDDPGYQDWIYCLRQAEDWTNPDFVSDQEHFLWPGKLSNGTIPNFVVPITPHWATELFDYNLAASSLFPRDTIKALNAEAVFYRSCYGCRMVAPARVLWYVSHDDGVIGSKMVRACSRLVEVTRDTPKVLFKRFRRLGVYQWSDVLGTAGGDVDQEIMALRFEDTELLQAPVPYRCLANELRHIGANVSMQCPVALPNDSFFKVYTQGIR